MKKLLTIVFCIALASCSRNLSANNVVSTDEAGIVTEGTILSVRTVQISETDKLQDNGAGMLAGGVVGGLAGSGIGGGSGQGVATAGAAIAGAALGAAIQQELGKSEGFEYIVKLNAKPSGSKNGYTDKTKITVGKESIKDKLKESINTPDTESNIISVVQGADTILTAGQKVYVIYSTDRIRLVPAN